MLPGLSVRDHFLLQISRANHMGLRHEARRDGKDCDEEASDQRSNRLPHITHCWESPLAICRQSNRGHIEFRKYERPKTFVITGRAAEFLARFNPLHGRAVEYCKISCGCSFAAGLMIR